MSIYHHIISNARGQVVNVDIDQFLVVPEALEKAWKMGPLAGSYRYSGLSVRSPGSPPSHLYIHIYKELS